MGTVVFASFKQAGEKKTAFEARGDEGVEGAENQGASTYFWYTSLVKNETEI